MRFFKVYEYLGPLILLPTSYYLWLRRFEYRHDFVLLSLSLPILFAYVIPGVGTNWLKLWEFNTRWRLGKFRPHHGFVFGSATSLLALVCLEDQAPNGGWFALFRAGLVMGSVLAFWNWLYDIYAIKAGFISVYNLQHSRRLGPEAVATAYAPVFFGAFGACYGIATSLYRYHLLERGCRGCFWWLFGVGTVAGLVIPVAAFVLYSYVTNGISGLKAYQEIPNRISPTEQSGT